MEGVKNLSKYDVIIIGGGPAGYVSAVRLSQLGLKTMLFEGSNIGGECLNFSCIPFKSTIYITDIIYNIKNFIKIGIFNMIPSISIRNLNLWRNRLIENLRRDIQSLLDKYNVTVIKKRVRRVRRRLVKTDDDEHQADHIIIATGSEPLDLPNVQFNGKYIISTRQLLNMEKLPESMMIVGGGASGVEAASILNEMGVDIHIVELMDTLIPFTDRDLGKRLERMFKRRGIHVYLSSRVSKVNIRDNRVNVEIISPSGEFQISCDKVLVSIGRRPRSGGLGLEMLGLKMDKNGYIIVDRYQRTNIRGIYAIGDVTGPPLLAHKAYWEALNVAEYIALGRGLKKPFSFPWVIFSKPEVVSVGMSEEDVQKLKINTNIIKIPTSASGIIRMRGGGPGLIKVVVNEKSRKIIGIHILYNEASRLAGIASLIVENRMKLEDVANTIFPHPTDSEIIWEVIRVALKSPIHT